MATGVIGQAQITNALQTMIAEAERYGEHQGVWRGTVINRTLKRKMGRDFNIPTLPPLTAAAVAADEEYDSPQQISDSKVTITPSEVVVQVEIGLRGEATSTLNLMSEMGQSMADAIEQKRDADGLATIDLLPAVLGSTSTTLSLDLIGKAASQIRSGRPGTGATARSGARTVGDPPKGQKLYGVFHEMNRFDLIAQFSGTGGAPTQVTTAAAAANYFGQSITEYQKKWIEDGTFVDRLAGVNMLLDNNFTITSNAIKGGVYAEGAFRHVTFSDYDDKEPWYSKDRRFVTLTAVADYGNGLFNGVWGIEVDVDCTNLV